MIFTLGACPPEHNLLCKNDFTPFVGPWGSLVSFVLGVYVTPVQIRAGPLIFSHRMRSASSPNRAVFSTTRVSCNYLRDPGAYPSHGGVVESVSRDVASMGVQVVSIPFTHQCRNRMLGFSCLRTVFGDLPRPCLSIVRRSATHGGPEAAGPSMR